MISQHLFFAHATLAIFFLLATNAEANIGSVCVSAQDCTSICLGGFCCNPALDTTNALACAQDTGVPLFASTTIEPDVNILDLIIDNWQISAGAGGGLLLLILITAFYIRRLHRKLRRRQTPTISNRVESISSIRKASDSRSTVSTPTSSRVSSNSIGDVGGDGYNAARNGHVDIGSGHMGVGIGYINVGGDSKSSFDGHGKKLSSFDEHSRTLSSLDGHGRKLSSFDAHSRTLSSLDGHGRKLSSFDDHGRKLSRFSSSSGTGSYFGRHLTRVQSRLRNSSRGRFGLVLKTPEDLVANVPPQPDTTAN